MNVLVMLANPDNQSFNHAIANSALKQLNKNGHNVFIASCNSGADGNVDFIFDYQEASWNDLLLKRIIGSVKG